MSIRTAIAAMVLALALQGGLSAACVYNQPVAVGSIPGGNTWIDPFSAAATDTVSSIQIYVSAPDNAYVGIYANNAGVPGALLGSSSLSAVVSGWNTVPLTSTVSVTASTAYWVAVGVSAPGTFHGTVFNASSGMYMTGAFGPLVSNPTATLASNTDTLAVVIGSTCPAPGSTSTLTPVPAPSSPTPTFSPSATSTATQTATPSLSPSSTQTSSPTGTPSSSPSGTRTSSPTPTLSPSPTATPSASPTATPSASPTSTPSASPTKTPSLTQSQSFSSTPSASPTATPSASPTVTTSFSASPSFSITPSFTASPVPTPDCQKVGRVYDLRSIAELIYGPVAYLNGLLFVPTLSGYALLDPAQKYALVGTIGKGQGTGPGQFDFGFSGRSRRNIVWEATQANYLASDCDSYFSPGRINRFDASGNTLGTFGGPYGYRIDGIAVGGTKVFVNDGGTIKRFDAAGTFEYSWNYGGGLESIDGIQADASSLYLYNHYYGKFTRTDFNGTTLSVWWLPQDRRDVNAMVAGNLHFWYSSGRTLFALDKATAQVLASVASGGSEFTLVGLAPVTLQDSYFNSRYSLLTTIPCGSELVEAPVPLSQVQENFKALLKGDNAPRPVSSRDGALSTWNFSELMRSLFAKAPGTAGNQNVSFRNNSVRMRLRVYNQAGQLAAVATQDVSYSNPAFSLDTHAFSSGVYVGIFEIVTDNGAIAADPVRFMVVH